MITGAHSIIFSRDAEADRQFFRDVLRFPHVDVGDGWLIFALPPAEMTVHPADESGKHELFLMCDDILALIDEMARHGIACEPVQSQDWGLLTYLPLPGGGNLGVYQPRHARPESAPAP